MKGWKSYRINLFLQDRLMGHYFEMENEAWIDYKKGDYTITKKNTFANLETHFSSKLRQ